MGFAPIMPMDPLPIPPSSGTLLTKEERTWAMIMHLSAFAGSVVPGMHIVCMNIIAPLVVWQIRKESSAFVNDHGREAVNAQISYTIYSFAAVALCFVLIGIPLLAGLYIANFILVIVAAIAANDGKTCRYPYILRLVK